MIVNKELVGFDEFFVGMRIYSGNWTVSGTIVGVEKNKVWYAPDNCGGTKRYIDKWSMDNVYKINECDDISNESLVGRRVKVEAVGPGFVLSEKESCIDRIPNLFHVALDDKTVNGSGELDPLTGRHCWTCNREHLTILDGDVKPEELRVGAVVFYESGGEHIRGTVYSIEEKETDLYNYGDITVKFDNALRGGGREIHEHPYNGRCGWVFSRSCADFLTWS